MADHHFDNVYIRAQDRRLNLIVVTRFGTAPLQMPWYQNSFNYAWPIIENLEPLLPTYQLPDALITTLTSLVNRYLPSSSPLAAKAASIINAALQLNWVHSGPGTAFLAICEAGITDQSLTPYTIDTSSSPTGSRLTQPAWSASSGTPTPTQSPATTSSAAPPSTLNN